MIRRLKRAAKRNSYWPHDASWEARHGPGVPYSSSWRRHNNPKPNLAFYQQFLDAGRHRRRHYEPRPRNRSRGPARGISTGGFLEPGYTISGWFDPHG